jgi:hypothetical protein
VDAGVEHGLVTHDEAADLSSTSRQLVQDWAVREGIDIATSRAAYLLKIWLWPAAFDGAFEEGRRTRL